VLNVTVTLAPTAAPEELAAGLSAVTAGAVRAPAAGSVNSRRFGVPAVAAETAPGVAAESSFAATSAGGRPGDRDSIMAAAPATCGEAIEVPLIRAVAVVEPGDADLMPTPGAYRSTQLP